MRAVSQCLFFQNYFIFSFCSYFYTVIQCENWEIIRNFHVHSLFLQIKLFGWSLLHEKSHYWFHYSWQPNTHLLGTGTCLKAAVHRIRFRQKSLVFGKFYERQLTLLWTVIRHVSGKVKTQQTLPGNRRRRSFRRYFAGSLFRVMWSDVRVRWSNLTDTDDFWPKRIRWTAALRPYVGNSLGEWAILSRCKNRKHAFFDKDTAISKNKLLLP